MKIAFKQFQYYILSIFGETWKTENCIPLIELTIIKTKKKLSLANEYNNNWLVGQYGKY